MFDKATGLKATSHYSSATRHRTMCAKNRALRVGLSPRHDHDDRDRRAGQCRVVRRPVSCAINKPAGSPQALT